MPYIDPSVCDRWIRARLLESTDLVAMVGNRIHPIRQDFEPIGWPYVLYEDSNSKFNNWAEMVTLRYSDYRIYMVMREDKLASGVEMSDFLRPGAKAIFKAFDGVSNHLSPTGTVHSCQITEPIWRYYGEETLHVAEFGVVARMIAN